MARFTAFSIAALVFALPALGGEPTQKPAAPTASPPGPGFHEVTFPVVAGAGEAKEAKAVLDTPHLKLATVTLRKGTVLAEHATPMPVTILALSGAGHVVTNGNKLRIEAGKMVALAPNIPHSVEPDAGTDLVVLVHHMKQGPMGHGPGAGRGKPGAPEGKGAPDSEKPRVPRQ